VVLKNNESLFEEINKKVENYITNNQDSNNKDLNLETINYKLNEISKEISMKVNIRDLCRMVD